MNDFIKILVLCHWYRGLNCNFGALYSPPPTYSNSLCVLSLLPVDSEFPTFISSTPFLMQTVGVLRCQYRLHFTYSIKHLSKYLWKYHSITSLKILLLEKKQKTTSITTLRVWCRNRIQIPSFQTISDILAAFKHSRFWQEEHSVQDSHLMSTDLHAANIPLLLMHLSSFILVSSILFTIFGKVFPLVPPATKLRQHRWVLFITFITKHLQIQQSLRSK